MAERRMFAKTIIDSDLFLDMPPSTQMLYFHLAMRADDDGFINNPKRIQRMIGATDDDMRILLAKQFILSFDSGVIVIRHWKIHNYIRKDLYHPTEYQTERKRLVAANAHSPYEFADDEDSAVNVTDTLQVRNETVTYPLQGRDDSVSLGKSKSRSKSKPRDRVSINAAAIARDTSSSEKCQEKNQDLYDDDRGEVVKTFCDNLQPFAGNLVLEQLNDAYNRYGKQWCLEAIKETAVNGGRSIQYVIKVLERWERDGFKSARKQKSVKESANGWQDMAADLLEDLEGDGREH